MTSAVTGNAQSSATAINTHQHELLCGIFSFPCFCCPCSAPDRCWRARVKIPWQAFPAAPPCPTTARSWTARMARCSPCAPNWAFSRPCRPSSAWCRRLIRLSPAASRRPAPRRHCRRCRASPHPQATAAACWEGCSRAQGCTWRPTLSVPARPVHRHLERRLGVAAGFQRQQLRSLQRQGLELSRDPASG